MTRSYAGGVRWQDDAACIGEPLSLFYPANPGSAAEQIHAAAKAVCTGCPVRVTCLDYAMSLEGASISYKHGVWGGLTAEERVALARRRSRRRG